MGQVIPKQQFDSQYPTGDAPFSVDNFRKNFQALHGGDFLPFRPLAHDVPDMRVMLLGSDAGQYQRGVYYGNNSQRITLGSGDSPIMSAPSVNPRIDLVYVTPSGDILVKTGTATANPSIPDISESGDRVPICAVYHKPTSTKIVNYVDRSSYTDDSYIMADLRPLYVVPRQSKYDELTAEIGRNTRNIMLNRLKIMELNNIAISQYVDGWADDFQDSTGIILKTEISGDLVAAGDKLRYSRNYAHQGTPNFNVAKSITASSTGFTTPFRPSDIPTGLKGYWKMDEPSGNRADSSGNGNTLQDNNTVSNLSTDYWKTGEKSAYFVAANSEKLSITDAAQTGLDMNGSDFSMSIWVKPISFGTHVSLMCKNTGSTDGYFFYLPPGDTRLNMIMNATTYASGTGVVAVGRWNHVAAVRNVSAGTLTLYVNGNAVLVSACADTLAGNSVDFTIGSVATTYTDAYMKDAAIWNVALTPIQIKSLALGVDLSTYAYRPNNVSTLPTIYAKLNELSGNRADSSANGLTLTDNGAVLAIGGYTEGVSPDFAATSDYFSRADNALLDITGTHSGCAWVYIGSAMGSGTRVIFGKGATAYSFAVHTDGKLKAVFNNSVYDDTGTALKINTWYHVGYAYDTTANLIYFYVDGKLNSTVAATTDPANNATDFTIGAGNANYSNFGLGGSNRIQDAAVWNGYVVTAAEFASLACGIPLQQTGIVSYWKLDETSGNRVDSIGANTLTDNATVLYGVGKVSNAADFELSNSEFLSITDASQSGLDLTTDFTLLSWINAESTGANASLISKWNSTTGYALRMSSANVFRLEIDGVGVETSDTLADATWGHIVGRWDGATKAVIINSALSASSAQTAAPTDTAHDFNLSGYNSASERYDGLMDETLVAKRWFRDEEIKTVYCKGLCAKEATSSEIASSSGGSGGTGGDGKGVVVLGGVGFDFLATKATVMLVTKIAQNITAEISRNSGDTWNPVTLATDFFDGTYYYRSGENVNISGAYALGPNSGDYYLTCVIPSGTSDTLEAYGVSLA